MTHYIQTYCRELDDLRRIAGASNESALRAAFQNLLSRSNMPCWNAVQTRRVTN